MSTNEIEILLVEDNPADLDLALYALRHNNLVNQIQVARDKSDGQTKTIPVVILTSSKEEKDLVQSYQLGVNSFIQKPVDFDQFRQIIKELQLYWLVVNQPPPARRSSA
ncbi:MAG: two-component system response regulator [Acidobacteria bacterium]|nr:MAG: two-component system response regulator [Acidobacteriota bacterium]